MKKVLALVVSTLLVLSAAVVWGQPLPVARPEQVGFSPERLAHITSAFKSEVDKGQLPGAVIVVARKGKIAYFESVGSRDKAAGTPMTNDTIFRIYSMTKPLASVAAMILVEDGKIQLTDPISKFLTPVKEAMVKSGFYDLKGQAFDQRDMTPMEYVERLAKAPLSQQPGRVWEYSVSVDVLGRVVE